ncbi:MAG: type I-D CRISPR-associated protein Cas10d/Csc3 [Anaerolineae bacterium]
MYEEEYVDENQHTEAPADDELPPEPLFSALLRRVVYRLWPDDPVLADFVTHVAPRLSVELAVKSAKGGEFAAEKAQEKGEAVRYAHDQTMRAHLVNGLFPALHVAKHLQAWGAPQLRRWDDRARRLFIAGFTLHDWVKLPEVERELKEAGLGHDANPNLHLPLIEDIFLRWCARLGLDLLLEPIGGVDAVLHDLIYLASNTQDRWGTLRNLSALPRQILDGRTRQLLVQLCRLADRIAYVGRNPRDAATNPSIGEMITSLSNGSASLTYHHLADNRGVLTNLIHNAALGAMGSEARVPLLYAPSGVVYLEHAGAPPLPGPGSVAEDTVRRVRQTCGHRLTTSLDGFRRDGKGIKFADYYWLYFDLAQMLGLSARAAFKLITPNKTPSAGRRYDKMIQQEFLPEEALAGLPDDLRVDQLAEFCYLAEKIVGERQSELDVTSVLLEALDLMDLRPQFEAVPRDNRAGGVGYHWYFAAGHYLKHHPGLSPDQWQARVEKLARTLAEALPAEDYATPESDRPAPGQPHGDGWDDLRAYVQQTLNLPRQADKETIPGLFATELQRYRNAKRRGRGTTAMCSLCSSSYTVDKQQEAGVLFAPQVYSNKMVLHGGKAIRDICAICGLEMMLRQILMNRSNLSGARFEGRNIRYLYFYPTYFFTPETLEVFRAAHNQIRRISFTELRRRLVTTDDSGVQLHLDPVTWQQIEDLLLDPSLLEDPARDPFVRMHYPTNESITFYFLGVPPPGRDAKDAESWVHPAFLSLLMPLLLDVKVVASESPLPLLVEADEMTELVYLDAPHAFVRYLTGVERINVDRILPQLQRLAVAYLIHLDANSRMRRGRYDYRWSDIPALARDLSTSPLYAFYYLKKWQRAIEADGIPQNKAQQYMGYVSYLLETNGYSQKGGVTMSYARELTDLYRRFYRAQRLNSNSILRPIAVASEAILKADRRLFGEEGLIEAVYGELYSFMDRVGSGRADGRFAPGSNWQSRQEAMRDFAGYFVRDVFYDALNGDVAALRGKQLNLLKSACEVIYRDAEAADWAARKAAE